MLTRIPTPRTWLLRAAAGPVPHNVTDRDVPAPVPGDVHTALRRASLIPDPVVGQNEHLLTWIGDTDWTYETKLPRLSGAAAEAEMVEIVLHGVDTIAKAYVDGQLRGSSRNMHRTWRLQASELTANDVRLRVDISSPVAAASAERDRLGTRPSAFSPLVPFIRKKACDFGWDWGPALTGAGIWRKVEIEAWSTARLDAVRPTPRVDDHGDGIIALDVEVVRAPSATAADLALRARVGGAEVTVPVAPGAHRVHADLVISQPDLWWPAGLGEQALHDLEVEILLGENVIDRQATRIGFRELTVDQSPDADGVEFGVTVNGERLFIKGFNWIPDDTSVALVTRDRYRTRIEQAQELGANLLRVWGGGVFEDDEFYRACDEAGMLVWQDFLFACAAYPEDEPFAAEVAAEAAENVTRLMPHPSLAVWNGNNENLWFWFLHDWETLLGGASWGEAFYTGILPGVVADLDPARSYLIGSPSSGDRWREPNDPTRGVVHLWVPDDYRAYDDTRPRFVSEFGFQGPPARATFDRAVGEERPAPFSAGTVQRQKAEGGTERINDVLDIHFGVPVDFDEWYWLAQLNQARAVRYGVERFRSLEPHCRGAILWQLNDCWPSLSWSVIDFADRWKPAAYAVREAFRDRTLILRIEEGEPALFACNSTSAAWNAVIEVRRGDAAAVGHAVERRQVVPAHSSVRVDLGPAAGALTRDELMVATLTGGAEPDGRRVRSVLLGSTDRHFADAEPLYGLEVAVVDGGVAVSVTAETLLRDSTLLVDLLDTDAHADRNLVTLLPGETERWHVRTDRPDVFTPAGLRGVLRTARAASERNEAYRSLAHLEAEKAARQASF